MKIDVLATVWHASVMLRKVGAYKQFVTAFCKQHACQLKDFNHEFMRLLWADEIYSTGSWIGIINDNMVGLGELMASTSTFEWSITNEGFGFWANIQQKISGIERKNYSFQYALRDSIVIERPDGQKYAYDTNG